MSRSEKLARIARNALWLESEELARYARNALGLEGVTIDWGSTPDSYGFTLYHIDGWEKKTIFLGSSYESAIEALKEMHL